MSAPSTREVPPVNASDRDRLTATLEPEGADIADQERQAELSLAIESAVSRLLALAMERGVEEQFAETD